jgi:hypothetical protein
LRFVNSILLAKMANPNWKPGVSGNPAGRAVGAKNKRTQEIADKLVGNRDPAAFLARLVADKTKPDELRLQASIALMPYKTAKFGLIPAPPPLVFVAQPVELPHPACTEIAHTIANIEHISALRRDGRLDQDTADRLVAEQRIIRDTLVEQAKLLVAQGGPPRQDIRIIGGMPVQPGFEGVLMPNIPRVADYPAVVNGEAVRPDPINPPVPVIPHPESPLAQKPDPPKHPVGDPERTTIPPPGPRSGLTGLAGAFAAQTPPRPRGSPRSMIFSYTRPGFPNM